MVLQSEPQVWGRNLKINDLNIIHRTMTCVEKKERKKEKWGYFDLCGKENLFRRLNLSQRC